MADHDITNTLRRGQSYTARTENESITGTYLGIETAHGVWSVLIRTNRGTRSIPRTTIVGLVPGPAV